MSQPSLFPEPEKQKKLGHAELNYKNASSIITKASGFVDSYDFTINPYSGCSFGCTYCYAAFFSRDKEKMDNWGYWIDVKENALALLRKKRKKPMEGSRIYMSTVTDPYQPIEKKLEVTRDILKELRDYHNVRLVIQTRAALVTRDIDIFKDFETLQVNMTVTTDSERVRKAFEPLCPSNKVRLKAIQEVHEAGVRSCITVTPLLPVEDPEQFAQDLKATGIDNFIIQGFHRKKGRFVKGTRDAATAILDEFNWGDEEYQRVLSIFQQYIPDIGVGQEGFKSI
jgi:DNA repair photolyase